MVENGGIVTTNREFCIGANLTFKCTIAVGAHDWTVIGFLGGTERNGRVTNGVTKTAGEFTLSAFGIATVNNDTRRSLLQVTIFERLVGKRTVTCQETGNIFNTQKATITVLGELFTIAKKFSFVG